MKEHIDEVFDQVKNSFLTDKIELEIDSYEVAEDTDEFSEVIIQGRILKPYLY